ncbi:MAG: hypothetical protein NVS9B2_02930 [Steroidobacteraceae bacterium]
MAIYPSPTADPVMRATATEVTPERGVSAAARMAAAAHVTATTAHVTATTAAVTATTAATRVAATAAATMLRKHRAGA